MHLRIAPKERIIEALSLFVFVIGWELVGMLPTMPAQASERPHEKCLSRQARLDACTFFAYALVRPNKRGRRQ
jgi:hypothetical protein